MREELEKGKEVIEEEETTTREKEGEELGSMGRGEEREEDRGTSRRLQNNQNCIQIVSENITGRWLLL